MGTTESCPEYGGVLILEGSLEICTCLCVGCQMGQNNAVLLKEGIHVGDIL